MSRARVAVLKVITRELSVTDAAASYGFSRRHLHRLLQRYWDGGIASQPVPVTIPELQTRLDRFRDEYNEHRPHRALDRTTPGEAYRATPKAQPATTPGEGHHRLRYDHVDQLGKMSIRRAGRMHTSASAHTTPENASSRSSTTPPSPSSTSPPARSSAPTSSTPTRPTGETKNRSPADGRAPNQ